MESVRASCPLLMGSSLRSGASFPAIFVRYTSNSFSLLVPVCFLARIIIRDVCAVGTSTKAQDRL